ncbi:NAD-dependent epimerase/dehydratase family protein, partial [Klebsiella pneumoniae]
DANIWGLRHLLDFYRGRDTLKGFLFFSSSEIYGDPDPQFIPTDEEYRGSVSCHGPRACYDESKRFGETMCWVYAKQYGMPVTVARPFNN